MGCFQIETKKKGEVIVSASMVCDVHNKIIGGLLDSIKRYLLDSLGRYLQAKKDTNE